MEIRYRSTRADADQPSIDLASALRQGLAPDGGLYLPDRLPPITIAPFTASARYPRQLATTATELLAPYLSPSLDLDPAARAIEAALDFPVTLSPLGSATPENTETWFLELFHGPTLAFKDVGARMLAQLLSATAQGPTVTVLTATSGDTGGAVADAFHRVPGTRVVVLYPRGQVSDHQERQFATLGDNIHAFAVDGTFDDCQRMVKATLRRPDLVERHHLTSANSINIGRLLPQVTYYVHAYRQLPLELRDRVVFVVPSGNFGNLTAGLIASLQGLPVRRFVAAVNANDVVPEYLATGSYEPRPSVRTLANAMDVGNPSNLERIQVLLDQDLDRLRALVHASTHDDAAIRQAIREVYTTHGRVIDPHTAVGWLAWQEYRELDPEAIGILLSTAHPAKFHEVVDPLVGHAIPIPDVLAAALQRPLLARPLGRRTQSLETILEKLPGG